MRYVYSDDAGSTADDLVGDYVDIDDALVEAVYQAENAYSGPRGCRVTVTVTEYDEETGEETDERSQVVDIEPDHDHLIREAGGDPQCDHDWTSEGEGGCDSNPGVWSTGGTSHSFASHCRVCGLQRTEHTTGSQYNPGDHDTVEYFQPDQWCADCQSATCECVEEEA